MSRACPDRPAVRAIGAVGVSACSATASLFSATASIFSTAVAASVVPALAGMAFAALAMPAPALAARSPLTPQTPLTALSPLTPQTPMAESFPPPWGVAPELAPPSPEPLEERGVLVDGSLASWRENWGSPDGTRYRVEGSFLRWGLAWRMSWPAALELRYEGGFAQALRSEAQALRSDGVDMAGPEPFHVLLSRTTLAWRPVRHVIPDAHGITSLRAGLGLMLDHQLHLPDQAPARPRDYLDEGQLRYGPFASLDATWRPRTASSWGLSLRGLLAPYLPAATAGDVAYPESWSALELRMGPTWRLGPVVVDAGLDGRLWQGGDFQQSAVSPYLGAAMAY